MHDLRDAAWSLPSPLDLLALAGWAVARTVVWLVVTPWTHVASVGVWWAATWAAAVLWTFNLGLRGLSDARRVFAGGEDVAAFDPLRGRSGWLGRAGDVIRIVQKGRAQLAATRIIGGFGTAGVLYAAALLWWGLLPLAAAAGWWVWWRQQPRRWEEGG